MAMLVFLENLPARSAAHLSVPSDIAARHVDLCMDVRTFGFIKTEVRRVFHQHLQHRSLLVLHSKDGPGAGKELSLADHLGSAMADNYDMC